MKSFYQYMRSQRLYDCPGSDLFEDMKRDDTFPKKATKHHDIWMHLHRKYACQAAFDTFEEWWGTYAHDEGLCENMTMMDCANRLYEILCEYEEEIDANAYGAIQNVIDDLYAAS